MPPSYLVGGFRYLVMAGDWNYVYRITNDMHMKIRNDRYPHDSDLEKKYPFLQDDGYQEQYSKPS